VESQLGRSVPGGADAIALGGLELSSLALAVAALAALLSLLPMALLRRRDLASALRGSAISTTPHKTARRLRATVLAGEIAFTLALLASGGLAVRSALTLEQREIGHVRQGVLTAGVGLRDGTYPGPVQQLAFADRLQQRLDAIPGVERAAFAAGALLGEMNPRPVIAEGGADDVEAQTGTRSVSPGYFAALDIVLRSGRTFGPQDRPDSPSAPSKRWRCGPSTCPRSKPSGSARPCARSPERRRTRPRESRPSETGAPRPGAAASRERSGLDQR
jgi:hypothetical protein